MEFYAIAAKQGTRFFDGEWHPYPADLYRLHTDPKVYAGERICIRTGKQPGDAIFATPNVVSDRFVKVLRECNASGFETFPVPLVRNNRQMAESYGLLVFGRGGPFDPVRSQAQMSGQTVMGYCGVHMDVAEWDGSDVFFIPGLGIGLYVTSRVATAIRHAKLQNVKVTLNAECRM